MRSKLSLSLLWRGNTRHHTHHGGFGLSCLVHWVVQQARFGAGQSTAASSPFNLVEGCMSASVSDNKLRELAACLVTAVRLASPCGNVLDNKNSSLGENSCIERSNGSRQALGAWRSPLTLAAPHNAMHQGALLALALPWRVVQQSF